LEELFVSNAIEMTKERHYQKVTFQPTVAGNSSVYRFELGFEQLGGDDIVNCQ